MDLDAYRERMATEHQRFTDAMMHMMASHGRTQTIFTDLLQDVDRHMREMQDGQDELKRLIMEQGEKILDLRRRLDAP